MPQCKKNKNTSHFSCSNCQKASRVIFGNGVIFCSGLVRRPNPRCDHFRFCIGRKDGTRSAFDIMIQEVMAMLSNLSTTFLKYLQKNPITKAKDQRKK